MSEISANGLLELRPFSLYKVQLFAKLADQLYGQNQTLVIDKARRTAKDSKDDYERACSSLALLRFLPADKRDRETQRIVHQLQRVKEGACAGTDTY